MQDKHLIVVCGPTASGKTELAIRLAKYFGTEILSADSRQFYKEMTIGTAKPSEEELSAAKHHFIGNLTIHQSYSAGQFELDALQKLEKLFLLRDHAILVGGSGLFIDAVCSGFNALPDISPETRDRVNKLYEEHGIEALQAEVQKVDPEAWDGIDTRNPRRLSRVIEIAWETGEKLSALRLPAKAERPFKTHFIALDWDRGALYDRINARVDIMVENGLIKEARALFPFKELSPLQTVGYRELFMHFEHAISLNEAIELIKRNSRRYAKRQLTWLRKKESLQWFDPGANDEIREFLEQKGVCPHH